MDDDFDDTDYKLASKYLEIKDNNILMHQEDIYIYDSPFWMKDNNKKLIMRDSRTCLNDQLSRHCAGTARYFIMK